MSFQKASKGGTQASDTFEIISCDFLKGFFNSLLDNIVVGIFGKLRPNITNEPNIYIYVFLCT